MTFIITFILAVWSFWEIRCLIKHDPAHSPLDFLADKTVELIRWIEGYR
jgi:hypothetical protein